MEGRLAVFRCQRAGVAAFPAAPPFRNTPVVWQLAGVELARCGSALTGRPRRHSRASQLAEGLRAARAAPGRQGTQLARELGPMGKSEGQRLKGQGSEVRAQRVRWIRGPRETYTRLMELPSFRDKATTRDSGRQSGPQAQTIGGKGGPLADPDWIRSKVPRVRRG